MTTIKVINESGEKASFGAKVMIGKTDRCLRSTGNVADLKFARAFNDRGRGSREEAMLVSRLSWRTGAFAPSFRIISSPQLN